jgi:hypothetical protein
VQSSSSSRARSKEVMNRIMFDVRDPLVVHVLVPTRCHMSLCMIIFASLIFGILSVTVHIFMCPKHTDDDSLSLS